MSKDKFIDTKLVNIREKLVDESKENNNSSSDVKSGSVKRADRSSGINDKEWKKAIFKRWDEFKAVRSDVIVRLQKALSSIPEDIVSSEKAVDLIVYFGFLKFSPINLYRLPERIKPKNTYVAGKILLPNVIDDRIFSIENWNFNLSDLDWI